MTEPRRRHWLPSWCHDRYDRTGRYRYNRGFLVLAVVLAAGEALHVAWTMRRRR